jgi:ribosomal protein S18 acetylase RimI-like enzyme
MITYTESLAGLEASQLQGFFVGWPNPPTPATHLKILQGSSHVVLALEDARVIGFINAVSDGVLTAYIPLLEVLPEYQGQGIGTELVRRLLERLRTLYMIDVLCDPEVQPFYERSGMMRASGMIVRNYDRQSGA